MAPCTGTGREQATRYTRGARTRCGTAKGGSPPGAVVVGGFAAGLTSRLPVGGGERAAGRPSTAPKPSSKTPGNARKHLGAAANRR